MANTSWWLCANCGYPNKPHIEQVMVPESKRPVPADMTRCEQCGFDRSLPGNVDYQPGVARA
jgi:ribosomal protein L37E